VIMRHVSMIALRFSRGDAKGVTLSLLTGPIKCDKSATGDERRAGRLTAGER
jgi:hypothetical protein